MLLADGKHTSGPEDVFKKNRVQKPGPREVTDKANRMHYCDNSNMLVPAENTLGYKT